MDIESKKWRVRSSSVVLGHVEITYKATGVSGIVPTRDVPHEAALAQMHENVFDTAMAKAMSNRAARA